MPHLPLLSGKEIVKIFLKLDYFVARQKGSHIRLSCIGKKSVTVPNHSSIGPGLLLKILRDAEVPVEEFLKLI